MKTLFLLRHGHAESKSDIPDEARNLDSTGRKEVGYIAEFLLKEGLRPDLMLASHANRSFQTAEIVAEKLAYPVKNIQIERDIYYTDEDTLLDVIKRQDDKYRSILLSGHNPTISYLARDLSKELKQSLPTSGLLVLECQGNTWEELAALPVRQIAFVEPELRVPGDR